MWASMWALSFFDSFLGSIMAQKVLYKVQKDLRVIRAYTLDFGFEGVGLSFLKLKYL